MKHSILWFINCLIIFSVVISPKSGGFIYQYVSQAPQDAKYYVILDPGHGGVDAGSPRSDVAQKCGIPSDLKEKGRTLDIALRVRDILVSNNIQVGMTHEDDTGPSLYDRTKYINTELPELVVSIHTNSAESCGDGVEAWYSSVGPNEKTNPHL